MPNLHDRIDDAGYQKVLSDMIDEFFAVTGSTELHKIVRTEASWDMTEVMIRYFSTKPDVEKSLATMFALGVFLANKNDAILPSNIQ